MDFFPVFLRLENKKILVVGGGEVASRKVDLLLRAGADITLISPQLHQYLASLVDKDQLTWVKKDYQSDDVHGYHQVWATTDNRTLNHQIFCDADAKGIWTNVVDDPQHCHFITPSMIDRNPIQVAISSGGASPVLVRYIREKLETQLPQNLNLLAAFSGLQRPRIKQYFSTVDERRKFWERFFRLPEVENATSEEQLEHAFNALLQQPDKTTGSLYVIETGSDPELLSLKALRLMQQAEYVLYPKGRNDIFVDLCRRDAERDEYIDSDIKSKALTLLAQEMRVCILLPKEAPTDLSTLYAELNNEQDNDQGYEQDVFIPCVG
ncbi:siroheme synthase [Photobacterium sp. SDRW27]|uniref:NAD(P)-dependent oxidoreductase n=1 Tax=Photobacterium obscurum TaxID=2829490 RepID=UPI00224480C5|nr:NAD(P)-dependent oxidoreductase [Photobacterium obscurum]MCW8329328.1 siroheme synthase [Photobacterium obscurum]